MSFDPAPDAYVALDRFIKISNPSLRAQLKHLTFQFRVMNALGLKADKDSLGKALAELPNLDTLTLSVSDPCRDTAIDISNLDSTNTGTRRTPSTLRRLQVAQGALPQLTKAFFKNCAEHSEEGWYRHALRLATEAGTAEELVSIDRYRRRALTVAGG